jgi:hypothetical protein
MLKFREYVVKITKELDPLRGRLPNPVNVSLKEKGMALTSCNVWIYLSVLVYEKPVPAG